MTNNMSTNYTNFPLKIFLLSLSIFTYSPVKGIENPFGIDSSRKKEEFFASIVSRQPILLPIDYEVSFDTSSLEVQLTRNEYLINKK